MEEGVLNASLQEGKYLLRSIPDEIRRGTAV
jgi:hypothetical protein